MIADKTMQVEALQHAQLQAQALTEQLHEITAQLDEAPLPSPPRPSPPCPLPLLSVLPRPSRPLLNPAGGAADTSVRGSRAALREKPGTAVD